MERQAILFYGKAGSGKGTQAKLLTEYLEKNDTIRPTLYVETGAHLRAFAAQDNFTASLAKKMIAEGQLFPEFLPIWIWTNCFIETFKGDCNAVMDGLGRRNAEVPVLFDALRFYGFSSIQIVVLDVSDAWAYERLQSRQRADDLHGEIKKRHAWFTENVQPAIEIWRTLPGAKLHVVHGEQSVEDVHKEVLKALQLS